MTTTAMVFITIMMPAPIKVMQAMVLMAPAVRIRLRQTVMGMAFPTIRMPAPDKVMRAMDWMAPAARIRHRTVMAMAMLTT
jgi:hypothetical protein